MTPMAQMKDWMALIGRMFLVYGVISVGLVFVFLIALFAYYHALMGIGIAVGIVLGWSAPRVSRRVSSVWNHVHFEPIKWQH